MSVSGPPTAVELALDERIVTMLRAQLAAVAAQTVSAITAEVTEYADPLQGELGPNITRAVQLALGTFLRIAEANEQGDQAAPLLPALDAAYALGRGEARSGRTMHALLSAYRVGARVAWREWGATAVDAGLPPATVVRFAELVFAYIDRLSAASVAGHTDELATSGRVREQYRERLCRALLTGASVEELVRRAEQADWAPPQTLTAVLVRAAYTHDALADLDRGTLHISAEHLTADAADSEPADTNVLLVPDVGTDRAALRRALRGPGAVLGPTRPWTAAAGSYHHATRLLAVLGPADDPLDTMDHLPALVLAADPDALADLRAQALAPLATLRPATAQRLGETLRSWLLHQGRRDAVARDLIVHPQTVRYRMTQLRDLYGERLTDPETVIQLVLALEADQLLPVWSEDS